MFWSGKCIHSHGEYPWIFASKSGPDSAPGHARELVWNVNRLLAFHQKIRYLTQTNYIRAQKGENVRSTGRGVAQRVCETPLRNASAKRPSQCYLLNTVTDKAPTGASGHSVCRSVSSGQPSVAPSRSKCIAINPFEYFITVISPSSKQVSEEDLDLSSLLTHSDVASGARSRALIA